MRILIVALAQLVILSSSLMALPSNPSFSPPPGQELGKWWKNSVIVTKLQLSEAQVSRIEQTFLNHRPELVGLNEELKHREAQLKTLMEAENLDESRIIAQTELVTAARMALERANASMMLDIRKCLTREQWKKLEEMRELRRILPSPPVFPAPNPPGIKPPKILNQPLPRYTPEAKQARIEGIILMQVIVRKDGTVDSVKVIKGLGYGLDESAIQTITKEWRFEPATLPNGQPIDFQATIEMSFRLY